MFLRLHFLLNNCLGDLLHLTLLFFGVVLVVVGNPLGILYKILVSFGRNLQRHVVSVNTDRVLENVYKVVNVVKTVVCVNRSPANIGGNSHALFDDSNFLSANTEIAKLTVRGASVSYGNEDVAQLNIYIKVPILDLFIDVTDHLVLLLLAFEGFNALLFLRLFLSQSFGFLSLELDDVLLRNGSPNHVLLDHIASCHLADLSGEVSLAWVQVTVAEEGSELWQQQGLRLDHLIADLNVSVVQLEQVVNREWISRLFE